MRYDREWLTGVVETRRNLEAISASVSRIADMSRRLVLAKTLNALERDFTDCISAGTDPTRTIAAIYEILTLAQAVVTEEEKWCDVYSSLDPAT